MQKQVTEHDDTRNWQLFVYVVMIFVLCFNFYNMVFIPLQFAYRIEFKGIFLAFEIFTILAYLVEIGIRVAQLKTASKIQPSTMKQNQFDKKLSKNDKDKLQQ
jgi:uncharacterized membrane protein